MIQFTIENVDKSPCKGIVNLANGYRIIVLSKPIASFKRRNKWNNLILHRNYRATIAY